jgi:futalosine hydrolase
MSFKILYVTATSSEADVLKKIRGIETVSDGYRKGNLEIKLLTTGVGCISTAWELKNWIAINGKPDLAINGGTAGSYKETIEIGDVVMPVSDCFADAGIEDGDDYLTLTESGLIRGDQFPFTGGYLLADKKFYCQFDNIVTPVNAITVNTATGSEHTRIKLLKKFNPDIETMEGATFFYICTREKIPFLALRAISNMVEKRNKKNWKIALALENLSERFNEIINILE